MVNMVSEVEQTLGTCLDFKARLFGYCSDFEVESLLQYCLWLIILFSHFSINPQGLQNSVTSLAASTSSRSSSSWLSSATCSFGGSTTIFFWRTSYTWNLSLESKRLQQQHMGRMGVKTRLWCVWSTRAAAARRPPFDKANAMNRRPTGVTSGQWNSVMCFMEICLWSGLLV